MKKSELQQLIREELNNVLKENFDISKEINIGDVVIDSMGDKLKIVKITPSQVELKPILYKAPNSVFPQDFGDNASIEDFWDYLEKY